MSEEFKCPSCGGTASIAYHRAGNNLLYCQDCQKAFSEVGAKIMKQAARIAELEAAIRRCCRNCWANHASDAAQCRLCGLKEALEGAGE